MENVFQRPVFHTTDTENKTELRRFIHIKGARSNNLKDIELFIPKNKLVVVTGVSGSGKSSLIIDTCLLYTSPSPRDRTRSRMPSSA